MWARAARWRLPGLAGAVLGVMLSACAAHPDAQAGRESGRGGAATADVLVFTRTEGFRHDSIVVAVDALRAVAEADGLRIEHTEDPAAFTAGNLSGFRAVAFVNTTGEVLDPAQQAAMEGFIRAGGGYLGVHSAADTGYDWPWYGGLVGAWFESHPPGLQTARVRFAGDGIADDGRTWRVTDEFYNFRDNPRGRVEVAATLESGDYEGGTMGPDHPIAWCHRYDGGRAWYTGLGHDARVYADPVFRRHLARGLRYAAGEADDC